MGPPAKFLYDLNLIRAMRACLPDKEGGMIRLQLLLSKKTHTTTWKKQEGARIIGPNVYQLSSKGKILDTSTFLVAILLLIEALNEL